MVQGSTDDKLRIIFDMCDNNRNGIIEKNELSEMLRSLVEIAKTNSISDREVSMPGSRKIVCYRSDKVTVFIKLVVLL